MVSNMPLKIEGIFVPHITPFKKNEELDESALRRLVRLWTEAGVSGLVPCGSTGEGAYMTREEKKGVVKIVLEEVVGKILVVMGTGCPSTRETILLTKDAKEVGADAVLVTSPYFFKPTNDELFEHYKTVVEAVDIPMILYNVPKFTGYNLDPSVVIRLVNEYDQIIAINDSAGSIAQIIRLVDAVGKTISVLAGAGDLIFPTLTMGGKGGVLAIANVAPQVCVELYKTFKKNALQTARQLQIQVSRLNSVLVGKYNQASCLKEGLNQLGLRGGYPRGPLLLPSENIKKEIQVLPLVKTSR